MTPDSIMIGAMLIGGFFGLVIGIYLVRLSGRIEERQLRPAVARLAAWVRQKAGRR